MVPGTVFGIQVGPCRGEIQKQPKTGIIPGTRYVRTYFSDGNFRNNFHKERTGPQLDSSSFPFEVKFRCRRWGRHEEDTRRLSSVPVSLLRFVTHSRKIETTKKKKKIKKKKRCPLRTEQKRGKRVSIILVVSPQPLGPSIKLVVLIVQCYGGTILNRTYGTHKTHRFRHFCYYGGTIVNMDLWYRQKPIYSASFTNNIWSY